MLRSGRIAPGLALVGAAIGLAGCGSGDGTIPSDAADALLGTLEDIQDDVNNGECSIAETDATQFVGQVDALPKEVGVEVKNVLFKAGENLKEMAGDPTKCKVPETGPTGETEFTPPPVTSTSTSTSTTTSTDEPPPEQPPNEGGNGPPGQEGNPNQGGGGGETGGTGG